ncbi:MAG: response regulator transcription factor [Ignavibacteriales bacterium]|nr:response regulator transcription factor [Ignavibacteriales bacterium]
MLSIRLLLIEDNRLLRKGIVERLKPYKDIFIITLPDNKDNLLKKTDAADPDVILIDLGLRYQNSLDVVENIRLEFSTAKIIVMDLAPAQDDVLHYVRAGANGFILKDAPLKEFLVTIRKVAVGENVLPPLLTDSLFSQIVNYALKKDTGTLKEAVEMTKREREVIALLSEGLSNKEISQEIKISTYTVKSHIHNIMEKLALHTRLEIANYSFSGGTI